MNGASDPVSGVIALMEEARVIGVLAKAGWKPARPRPAACQRRRMPWARFTRLVRGHEKRIASHLSAAEIRVLIELLEKVHMGARSL